jgi:hypothetical protein
MVLRKLFKRNKGKLLPKAKTKYMNWLTYANAGMLNPGSIDCIDYAMKNLSSASPILEIGAFCGLSCNTLTYYKRRNGLNNSVITCDSWTFENPENSEMLEGGEWIRYAEYRQLVKDSFARNISFFSRNDLPYAFEMTSDDFFAAWSNLRQYKDLFEREFVFGGPLSFCFIDGNHTYDYVRRDFENCDKFLEPKGFLLLDDSGDRSEYKGVCKVRDEVFKSGKYDFISKNPNYFFRKK